MGGSGGNYIYMGFFYLILALKALKIFAFNCSPIWYITQKGGLPCRRPKPNALAPRMMRGLNPCR
jgi:hypothetical protein